MIGSEAVDIKVTGIDLKSPCLDHIHNCQTQTPHQFYKVRTHAHTIMMNVYIMYTHL